MEFQAPKRRYHRIDGWRGYVVPALAVVGASITGPGDCPCPTDDVMAELKRFQKECLRPLWIRSRLEWGQTSNVFCGKRWMKVSKIDFARAAEAAKRPWSKHLRSIMKKIGPDGEKLYKKVNGREV